MNKVGSHTSATQELGRARGGTAPANAAGGLAEAPFRHAVTHLVEKQHVLSSSRVLRKWSFDARQQVRVYIVDSYSLINLTRLEKAM